MFKMCSRLCNLFCETKISIHVQTAKQIVQPKRLILASASPRRKELIKLLPYEFEIQPSSVHEEVNEDVSPIVFAKILAARKASDVADNNPACIVVGCDTIVCLDGAILGKPTTLDEAINTLQLLSGKKHKVITSIAAIEKKDDALYTHFSLAVETEIHFAELQKEEIQRYVYEMRPLDKAGSYGIQDKYAALFVKSIIGDFYNVVGLPVNELYDSLKKILS